jgi:hypothetical protein
MTDKDVYDSIKSELAVYNIINVPNPATFYPVSNITHAALLIQHMSLQQLKDSSIDSNVFGLVVWCEEDLSWEEWEDEYGNEIKDLSKKLIADSNATDLQSWIKLNNV